MPNSPETHGIPSAADFERWGLLTRKPAPNGAQSVTGVTIRMVIRSDGTVLPTHLCDHQGWNFKQHGRCCHACGAFIVDFGD